MPAAAAGPSCGHGSRAQAVVWQLGTFVRTIPPEAGDWALSALGANACGTVVGHSGHPSSAFVSLGGATLNLNDLVPGNPRNRWLCEGRDVNDLGQIVVDGQFGCCRYLPHP